MHILVKIANGSLIAPFCVLYVFPSDTSRYHATVLTGGRGAMIQRYEEGVPPQIGIHFPSLDPLLLFPLECTPLVQSPTF